MIADLFGFQILYIIHFLVQSENEKSYFQRFYNDFIVTLITKNRKNTTQAQLLGRYIKLKNVNLHKSGKLDRIEKLPARKYL